MEHIYRSYYTKSDYITQYMVKMLNPNEQDKILEPCGGDGVFIDSLLEVNKDLKIDTCDLNSEAVAKLTDKYCENNNINIWQTDTLFDETFDKYAADRSGYYDKIIGNPPYGGWQEYERRDELKKKYNGFYVKETYSLFLLRCISMLKEGGVLSFIIPDTFLFLHNHTSLRSYLLTNTMIREILIFPSKFFPGVSFGYSNLSIITVEKTSKKEDAFNNVVRIIKGMKTDKDLERIRLNNPIEDLTIIKLRQEEIYGVEHHAFILNNGQLSDLISNTELQLGDIADCVTGIYSGDNKRFFVVANESVRSSAGYPIVSDNEVDTNCVSLTGTEEFKYVPIVKSSSRTRYIRDSIDWYIDWSKDAIKHYNTDKKARFQNSQFYFKKGIALPMVKSSKINATLMDKMVFDQSIVGVFPKEDRYYYYILGFLNSDIANQLIHVINPTANNSANYLKKLPIILPSEEDMQYISAKVKDIVDNPVSIEERHEEVNEFFNRLYA